MMKPNKKIMTLLSLTLLGFACNEGREFSEGRSTANKGKDEFKQKLSLGAGAFRPIDLQTSSSLNLAGQELANVKIDQHSGAWSWAGFDTSKEETIPANADLIKVAKEIIAAHESELGFAPGEVLLAEQAIQTPYEKTKMIVLHRQFQGVPVKGAFLHIFFAVQSDGSYRLSEIVNNSFGAIKQPQGTNVLLTDQTANEVSGVSELKVNSKQLVLAPFFKEGRYEFSYATEYALTDPETDEKISLTVDNQSKSIHEAYSNRVYEMNEIHAETYKSSYVLKDIITRPLEFLQIIDGAKDLSTDQLGKIDLSSSKVSVVLHNTKNNSKIYSAANTKTPITFDIDVDKNGKSVIKFGQGNATGINVYASVTETINYAAKYLSEQELSLIRDGFDSVVDINDQCNAYYNGKLNFFKQSTKCANTGLISDVVKHEWGHGLDDFLGPVSRGNSNQSGIRDSAYSEGIGDILAAYIARSPNMGPGFFLNDPSPLRNLLNNKTYPPANQNESEPHTLGLIVGGAFWDMHVNLSNLYGSDLGNDTAARLFFRHLLSSDRYLDAYQAVLRVDDDDGNAMTKSPHYCAITKAFGRHNITGGEKLPTDCLDTDRSIQVKIDQDKGEGKLTLLLSAGGAARIVACPGKVNTCTTETKGYVDFPGAEGDDINTVKGSRKFLTAKGTLDTKLDSIYTFFSIDAKNVMMAKRSLEFKPADSTTEKPKDEQTTPLKK